MSSRLKSAASGLSEEEAAERLRRYGPNTFPEPPRRSLVRILLAQLASPLIYLLLAAALAALVLGEVANALFIGSVLLLNSAIGGVQEWQAEENSAALRSAIKGLSRVLRGGSLRLVESVDLVPGDVALLEAGDRVPADIRLLRSFEVRADELLLTGESFPVGKSTRDEPASDAPLAERPTILHAGSTVQTGRAEGVVVATGASTEFGRIAKALAGEAGQPPLTRRQLDDRGVCDLRRGDGGLDFAFFAFAMASG